MTKPVTWVTDGSIAVVTVNNPPVNALSHAVREGIVEAFEAAGSDASVDAIVLACAGRTFIAGADITEFGKPLKQPDLRAMHEVMDAAPKLTVAAIHGTALGGGLETALACHYRIALDSARVGLPEVNLGLLPGAGGTQRLPRLAGVEPALDMMIRGAPIAAAKALSLGIVDRVVDADLEQAAVDYARELVAQSAELRKTSALPAPTAADDLFDDYRKKNSRAFRGFEAPGRIVKSVQAAVGKSFEEGMAVERRLFEECMASDQSAAMRHMFFADRAAAKVPGIDKSTPRRSIATVGIIGAGTMGAGIALACLNAGLRVTLLDANSEGLARGRETIEKLTADMVKKNRIDEAGRQDRLDRLSLSEDYAALGDADLVIEAVFETMAIKEEVFGKLDAHCKDGAILATNTSTLDVDRIAAATKRPEDVIGLHFFSPANIMKLLEIVRGEKNR